MEDPHYRALMNYAMRALARREHTSHELHQKLKKQADYSKQRGETVLSRLKELRLLNDEAFIQKRLEEASQIRFQGRMKVATRLYKKGIPFSKTEEAWHELGISEKELAKEALHRVAKRFEQVPKEKLYQRKAQFLSTRGFSPETIYSVLSNPPAEGFFRRPC